MTTHNGMAQPHQGAVPYQFSGQIYNLVPNVITQETIDFFLHGHCAILAIALHLRTGLTPLMVATSSKRGQKWEGHAFIKMGENQYLDIAGMRTMETMQEDFAGELKTPRIIPASKFTAMMFNIPRPQNGLNFLGEQEREYVEGIADILVRQEGLSFS